MSELKKGDYVLATKYSDGDPQDHFVVGFFDGMLKKGSSERYHRYNVVDGEGRLFRGNGFRRCEKISNRVGTILVDNMSFIEQGSCSVWYWRRNVKKLEDNQ